MPKTIPTEHVRCVVCGSDSPIVEACGRDYLYETVDQEFRFVRCDNCGHLYLNPRPTLETINIIYPVEYSSFSGRFADAKSMIARVKDAVIMRRFSVVGLDRERPRILDVGCGDGRFLMALRRLLPDAELYGLDWKFAPEIADELRRCNVHLITGVIETAELPEASFDVIIMNQLIEHVWEPRAVLERCRRALRVGGKLALETPNPNGYDRKWFKSGAWGSYYWPRHLNLFSRNNLERLVEECGLQVDSWHPLLAAPCWIYSMRSVASRNGFRSPLFDRIFSDTNLLALALFASIDFLARLFKLETSNQKLVAIRR